MTSLFIGIILGILTTLVVYIAYMFVIAFTFWMAVDAGKQDRFWWVLIVLGIPLIGPAVYFFTEKKHEYAKIPSHHIHNSPTEMQHEASHQKHEKQEVVSSEDGESTHKS